MAKSNGQGENGYLKVVVPPPIKPPLETGYVSPLRDKFERKEALSYANILRWRNKFVDALALYESIIEKKSGNVEAHIGKGICLQMQNMSRLAFESFAKAIELDPENACALTHCGILYKDEGQHSSDKKLKQKKLASN